MFQKGEREGTNLIEVSLRICSRVKRHGILRVLHSVQEFEPAASHCHRKQRKHRYMEKGCLRVKWGKGSKIRVWIPLLYVLCKRRSLALCDDVGKVFLD